MSDSIFSYEFATNALVSMFFLSILAGIVGTYIVVRRMVFVAGGITHSAFGGIGIAYFLGLPPVGGAMAFAVLTAFGIELLNKKGKVREDSAIAMLWSLGMSVGIIFMFLTPGYAPNLMGFMFGDILAVSRADIWAVGLMAAAVTVATVIFYRPILYTSFDPDFAALTGWPVRAISVAMSIVVALSIVLSIKAVGIILVLSLFTIPQAIANLFTSNMRNMMVVSTIIAAAGSLGGLAAAFVIDLPAGATITALLAGAFIVIKSTLYIVAASRKART